MRASAVVRRCDLIINLASEGTRDKKGPPSRAACCRWDDTPVGPGVFVLGAAAATEAECRTSDEDDSQG